MCFHSVEEIVEELKQGHFVILVDDEARENEGDLIIASDFVSPEAINFMSKFARGLICVSITQAQAKKLSLPLMVRPEDNFSPHKTAFTVSVEAARGVSTGISARDRAQTIQILCHPHSKPEDIISPGHIFPIKAQEGGVLKRAGHTEASVDFCKLAGLTPSAIICEIVNSDGTMARIKELIDFSKKHKFKIGTIESLIQYRMAHDSLVEQKAYAPFQTGLGKDWKLAVFYDSVNNKEHLVCIKGDISSEKTVLVRMQISCLTGDLFKDQLLPTGDYLRKSISLINQEGSGVLVYLRMQNNLSKYVDYHKNKKNNSLFLKSDERDYGIGAQILRALGIKKIKLITNKASKKVGLKGYGLSIVENVSLDIK
ncbi:MAG: 3,4-dihydroxy-2-butanone-4-phosphate synthase [Bdellovibrionales bacterium]|nr:3,4-dihydroxy-2-butanone-4-phosphate synthase [Bdellovibrionales bacterium]